MGTTARQPTRRTPVPRPPSSWRSSQGHSARSIKREAVIRSAARAFNQRGYHNTSLDDVARMLGVTKPTLYYYVHNKEDLLFECFRTGLKPIRAAFREISRQRAPARSRLTQVLQHYAETIASDYGGCLVRAEDLNLGTTLHARVKTLKSGIDQGIRRLLREGIADGSIACDDPKMTAFAIAGALNWIAHWYRDNQALNAAEVARCFVALFEQGLEPR